MTEYLFVGPQKTGSTFLYEYFKAHTQTQVSSQVKEIYFFTDHFKKGLDWYHSHFKDDEGLKLDFEPTIFGNQEAVLHAAEYDFRKIIVVLRDPFVRIMSLANHWRRYGKLHDSLEHHLSEDDEGLLSSSLYSSNIQMLADVFGSERVEVFYFEDLFDENFSGLRNLCQCLGVDFEDNDVLSKKVNAAAKPRSRVLAKFATRLSKRLKGYRLYWLINLFKTVGVRELIYGNDGESKTKVSSEEMRTIRSFLYEDAQELKAKNLYHASWTKSDLISQ